MPSLNNILIGKLYINNFNLNTYKIIEKKEINIDNQNVELIILRNIFTQQIIVRTPQEICGTEDTRKEFNKVIETNKKCKSTLTEKP